MPEAGTITLVVANGDSPTISADGTEVAFTSIDRNLAPNDTNSSTQVFVKNLVTGAVTLVSADAHGIVGDNPSDSPVISPDGSRVAFASYADNLVPGDNNGTEDIFVKDLGTGAITLVSSNSQGVQADWASMHKPAFSPDGTKLVFSSKADNLIPGAYNGDYSLYMKDLATGSLSLVSSNASGMTGDNESRMPAFSPDGSQIVFSSSSDNLTPRDYNNAADIFLKYLQDGTTGSFTQGNIGNNFDPVFSPDGREIAYSSTSVGSNATGTQQVYTFDLYTGQTTLISSTASGTQGNHDSGSPQFSADGSKIVFSSNASNLVAGDTNGVGDIFVKDLTTGAIDLVSADAQGQEGDGASYDASFSPDGTKVVFHTDASNLVAGGSTGSIVIKDLACYRAGTLIGTARGAVPIETIVAGDAVITAEDASEPVIWVGHRTVDCSRHPTPERVWPYRVAAGALGSGAPARDLWVSPGHALAVTVAGEEVLVPVEALANGATIASVPVDTVSYWHVELPRHAVILAEGARSESYLDTGNRAGFENGGAPMALHPDFGPRGGARGVDAYCRPHVVSGQKLATARAIVRGNAEALGWRTRVVDPDLRIVVDGQTVRPTTQGRWAKFAVPADPKSLRIVSNGFVPHDTSPERDDRRTLGVLVCELVIDEASGARHSIALDHPRLGAGFHAIQPSPSGDYRWTNGSAALDPALWSGFTGSFTLYIKYGIKDALAWHGPVPAMPETAVA